MSEQQTTSAFDPNYQITATSRFHDVVLQLAYNLGFERQEAAESLHKNLEHVLNTVGGKKDSFSATVKADTYGVTLSDVGQGLAADQCHRVAATIVAAAKEFAEYAPMDLTPYVELEPGEEKMSKEEITAKVMFAMVTGTEYNLGKLSREKVPAPK